jgi:beta-1,4-mannosyl-glycoprotein beta-1,4-N-acetylglucosaminyltransferase
MIYDCFCFFKEIDLLIFRLEFLDKKVDKFIIVEASKTHTGISKKFYIEEMWDKLNKFHKKITYIKIDNFPINGKPWDYENYQRNMIAVGWENCQDDDLIMISDLDEIPDPKKIPDSMPDGVVKCFLQDNYYYFANNYNSKNIIWEGGTKILNFKTIRKNLFSEKYVKYNSLTFSNFLNIGFTPTKIRLYRNLKYIRNGGWHFGWLGGVDFIMSKLQATPHQEHNNAKINNPYYILSCLSSGEDLLDKNNKCYVVSKLNFPSEIQRLMPNEFFLDSDRQLKTIKYNFLKYKQMFQIYIRNIARKFIG